MGTTMNTPSQQRLAFVFCRPHYLTCQLYWHTHMFICCLRLNPSTLLSRICHILSISLEWRVEGWVEECTSILLVSSGAPPAVLSRGWTGPCEAWVGKRWRDTPSLSLGPALGTVRGAGGCLRPRSRLNTGPLRRS